MGPSGRFGALPRDDSNRRQGGVPGTGQPLSAALYTKKDLGHVWLGYIRMVGHLQLSVHLPDFEGL